MFEIPMPKNKIFHSPRQHFLFHSTIPLFPSSFTPSSHRCSIFLVPMFTTTNLVRWRMFVLDALCKRRIYQTSNLRPAKMWKSYRLSTAWAYGRSCCGGYMLMASSSERGNLYPFVLVCLGVHVSG